MSYTYELFIVFCDKLLLSTFKIFLFLFFIIAFSSNSFRDCNAFILSITPVPRKFRFIF